MKYSRIVQSAVLLALFGIGIPSATLAHGPTIMISHVEFTPPQLNLFVGTTVHFYNTVAMPGGHVIVDESGTIESPALQTPGDDWHYTFEKEGRFDLYLEQHPAVRMRVVVVPAR